MKSGKFSNFIVLICQFCQKMMGSRNPLLKIDGFLGTHADEAPVLYIIRGGKIHEHKNLNLVKPLEIF